MWNRKNCAICRTNFAVHPHAKTAEIRTLCRECRKIPKGGYGYYWTGKQYMCTKIAVRKEI